MEPIVDPDWLAAHLGEVVILHVGSTMAGDEPRQRHLDAHLPGARFVSLDDDLSSSPGAGIGRHPLPAPEHFAAALGRLGVDDGAPVVAYDDSGGGFASRLVWMLRAIGTDAALLDGGAANWPGTVESGPTDHPSVRRSPVPWPDDAVADSDEVAATIDRGGVVVDSREPARYRGEVEPIDAVAGHVPGAINLPFADNLRTGRWRPIAELADRFEPLRAAAEAGELIVYCGSGVTACHNALAIEAAGLPRPKLYVGSWSGWSTEPGREIATSAEA